MMVALRLVKGAILYSNSHPILVDMSSHLMPVRWTIPGYDLVHQEGIEPSITGRKPIALTSWLLVYEWAEELLLPPT